MGKYVLSNALSLKTELLFTKILLFKKFFKHDLKIYLPADGYERQFHFKLS